jgi:SAM-dependent methyltransferase
MTDIPRWFTGTKDGHSQWYVDRFRQLAAEGADLAGEARLVDAVTAPKSRILDAGCGPGRVGAELHARGHVVVGADVDPVLVAAAEVDHPGPRWVVADLSSLDLDEEPFDVAVVAGNVMVFVAPGTEQRVLESLRRHVRPGGRIIVGFATDRDLELPVFDAAAAAAGLTLEQRFDTWDLVPFSDDADFAVTFLRVPPA